MLEETIFEGLAKEWNIRTLTPAFVFWAGGFIALSSFYKWDWGHLFGAYENLNAVEQIILILVSLFLVTVSSGIIQWFTLPLLRLAEGYWPNHLSKIKQLLVMRVNKEIIIKRYRYAELGKNYSALSASDLDEYIRLDYKLDNYPKKQILLLPTRLGNVLRAAEEYPGVRYGLNSTVVWSRLWLALPESTKNEIGLARETLNERMHLFAWCLAFSIWTPWAWWALIAALLGAIIAYSGLLLAASNYSDLFRASFDMHRFDLYKSLHIMPPISPKHEDLEGRTLSMYLRRGDDNGIWFRHEHDGK